MRARTFALSLLFGISAACGKEGDNGAGAVDPSGSFVGRWTLSRELTLRATLERAAFEWSGFHRGKTGEEFRGEQSGLEKRVSREFEEMQRREFFPATLEIRATGEYSWTLTSSGRVFEKGTWKADLHEVVGLASGAGVPVPSRRTRLTAELTPADGEDASYARMLPSVLEWHPAQPDRLEGREFTEAVVTLQRVGSETTPSAPMKGAPPGDDAAGKVVGRWISSREESLAASLARLSTEYALERALLARGARTDEDLERDKKRIEEEVSRAFGLHEGPRGLPATVEILPSGEYVWTRSDTGAVWAKGPWVAASAEVPVLVPEDPSHPIGERRAVVIGGLEVREGDSRALYSDITWEPWHDRIRMANSYGEGTIVFLREPAPAPR